MLWKWSRGVLGVVDSRLCRIQGGYPINGLMGRFSLRTYPPSPPKPPYRFRLLREGTVVGVVALPSNPTLPGTLGEYLPKP